MTDQWLDRMENIRISILRQLVALANGFQKKIQKTPRKEIEMAIKIKAEYELEIANSRK